MVDSPTAVQRERVRDMRSQISGIEREDMQEVSFEILAPGRRKHRIYSMVDGQHADIPEYMLDATLAKQLQDGTFEFTSMAEKAPTYVPGDIKCAFHGESPERESDLLAEAGVAGTFCPKSNLRSGYAKREHGRNKHSKETEAVQSQLDEQKEAKREERDEATLAAQQAMASAALGNTEGNAKTKVAKPS